MAPQRNMNQTTPATLKEALERAGWPERQFRSVSAALRLALDYLEHQQANGVSRASLHQEFTGLGFVCQFNTFAVALKRAKARTKTEKAVREPPAVIPAKPTAIETQGGPRTNSNPAKDGGQAKPPKGEIAGFVSSEKTDPRKLREQLV